MAYLFLNSVVENKSCAFYTVPLCLPVAVAAECITTRILKKPCNSFSNIHWAFLRSFQYCLIDEVCSVEHKANVIFVYTSACSIIHINRIFFQLSLHYGSVFVLGSSGVTLELRQTSGHHNQSNICPQPDSKNNPSMPSFSLCSLSHSSFFPHLLPVTSDRVL